MSSLHKTGTVIIALLLAMLTASGQELHAAQTSYAPQILQYVREDKVYLLENIRKNLTIPSEKLLVEALLSEDGPQAAYLYRKQLAEYPDPSLDAISTSRLSSFQFALNQPLAFAEVVPPAVAAPAQKTPAQTQAATQKPAITQPQQLKESTTMPGPALRPDTAGTLFTLQFGSFSNRTNAENLAMQLASYGEVAIIQNDGMHKVRLRKTWQSENQAIDAGRTIPFTSVAVPVR
ncbi:MAG: SPOR domain-containing protein [Chlorobium sp.]|uniref:SPOR domain-containing protein n=1 Tax=Chlorobium sp. TaxID=1095 RepID=UPI002F3E1F5F